MRELLRQLMAAGFYYSGLVKLALWWKQRSGQQLIVLNYHRACGNLGSQMRYLRRHYRIMHLEDALEEFYAQADRKQVEKRRRDRRIPLVLTFDDGYLDNYTYAAALARKLQVPITIFVIPGYVESGEYFWWLAAKKLVKHLDVDKVQFEGRSYHFDEAGEREQLRKAIDARMRYATSVEERETFLVEVQQALGICLPKRGEEDPDADALSVSWEQIREMEQSGWVSFGSHTMHHPVLGFLSDPAEVQREAEESRCLLEQRLGHPVRIFAYPIGKLNHIGDTGLQAVKNAGYDWAVTTLEESITAQSNPLLLGRVPGDVDLHWTVMACELAGSLGIVSRFKKRYVRFLR